MKRPSPKVGAILGTLPVIFLFGGFLVLYVNVFWARPTSSLQEAFLSVWDLRIFKGKYIVFVCFLELFLLFLLLSRIGRLSLGMQIFRVVILAIIFLDLRAIQLEVSKDFLRGLGLGTLGTFFHAFQIFLSWEYLFPPKRG